MLLLRHFYLIYFNILQVSLYKDRASYVAEKVLSGIVVQWLLFLFFLVHSFFGDADFHFVASHIWWFISGAIAVGLLVYYLAKAVLHRTWVIVHDELDAVRDWKRSGYRRRAVFWMLFYLFVFPFVTGLAAIWPVLFLNL